MATVAQKENFKRNIKEWLDKHGMTATEEQITDIVEKIISNGVKNQTND